MDAAAVSELFYWNLAFNLWWHLALTDGYSHYFVLFDILPTRLSISWSQVEISFYYAFSLEHHTWLILLSSNNTSKSNHSSDLNTCRTYGLLLFSFVSPLKLTESINLGTVIPLLESSFMGHPMLRIHTWPDTPSWRRYSLSLKQLWGKWSIKVLRKPKGCKHWQTQHPQTSDAFLACAESLFPWWYEAILNVFTSTLQRSTWKTMILNFTLEFLTSHIWIL